MVEENLKTPDTSLKNSPPPPDGGKPAKPQEQTETYFSTSDLDLQICNALTEGDTEQFENLIGDLHPSDLAHIIGRLDKSQRTAMFEALKDNLDPEILPELDEVIRDELVEYLGTEHFAAVVSELDSDDAVGVVEYLEEERQQEVLNAISIENRSLIETSLSYPEKTAGRLMQREVVSIPQHWTVGDTIDYMRRSADMDTPYLPSVFYDIFVIDPACKPLGIISLSLILKSGRNVLVTDLMAQKQMKLVPAAMDQEEVAYLFSQRDLISAPVIDGDGRLVGVITIDDIVDVINEEIQEDMMALGGVQEDDLYDAAIDTTKSRFGWLLLNLGTAVLASVVISFFDDALEKVVALAILMPIVASMGGNAGTQTLTVAVRALATRELTMTNAARIVTKEFIVGGMNGIMFALLTGVLAWAWFQDPYLGFILAIAMLINLLVAGFVGVMIPILLEKTGTDPAISSSIFLTTITDVVGFAVFLGIAAWFLP